jgi:uncharacterized protein (TIGR00255 family)
MTVKSMTGFSRSSGTYDGFQWTWEIKSVNSKGLEVRIRVPNFLDGLDLKAKKLMSKAVGRGSINIALTLDREKSEESVNINENILGQLIEISTKLAENKALTPASIDGLLGMRGVLEVSEKKLDEDGIQQLEKALLANFNEAIVSLVTARGDEGAHLDTMLRDHLSKLTELVDASENAEGTQPAQLKARLQEKITEMLGEKQKLNDERLEQEVALLASKADIREEVNRLNAHIAGALDLMNSGETVGRRLDFLSQELNREANTLCSKSADLELTKMGLDMKATIEQFREQVQNVE